MIAFVLNITAQLWAVVVTFPEAMTV